jgi:nucleoside-diphosphate-sugar epimerase
MMMKAGVPIPVHREQPNVYNPIHEDDYVAQIPRMLEIARVPATIVNWAGDEPVSVQEYCAYIGELGGFEAQVDVVEQPGTLRGSVTDNNRRTWFTGPCAVTWREGLKRVYDARTGAGS